MTYDLHAIVNHLLLSVEPYLEDGEVMTKGKLQRLLYYLQGFWLSVLEEPLFSDPIEAWFYGPTVPEVHDCYSTEPKPNRKVKFKFATAREEELWEEVLSVYAPVSGADLEILSRSESPWLSVDIGTGSNIGMETIADYFRDNLVKDIGGLA